MAGVEIIDANVTHAQAVSEIVRAARHEAYGQLGADYINAMHDDVGGFDVYFGSLIEESHYSRAAMLGQELVGIAIAGVLEDRPGTLQLGYLYVQQTHQRMGIGSLLLDDVVSDAKRDGFSGLTLNVFSGNERAVRLYEGRGFVHVGCLLKPYYAQLGQGYVMDMEVPK